ncbi:MAG: M1 family metallopeptidase [Gemmatimonadota bacterium]
MFERAVRSLTLGLVIGLALPALPAVAPDGGFVSTAARAQQATGGRAQSTLSKADTTEARAAGHDPKEAFGALDLPPADEVRAVSGAPGEGYWQQRADYRIEATLDEDGHRISGRETITYTNHSPDSLRSLWLQLDQNLFREDSYGAQRAEEGQRHGGFFDEGGFDLASLTLERDGEAVVPEYRVEDTMLEVLLERPLAPAGGELRLQIEFSFTIPERGADRMGRLDVEGGRIYQLAQWYPRMFTYDDVHGWNHSPYLGQGEWYLEYGDFEVEITVPREYIVVGTGVLANPEAVLTAAQRERLAEASRASRTVLIIGPDEVGDSDTRPPGEGPLTWRFRAENVRDFGWAASDRFVWDAASWKDVLLQSVYPRESIGTAGFSGWERSTEYLRHSIAHYSERWVPYPYPTATNVAGLALGMEYPMIVFCSWQARGAFLFAVTDHEIGHTWFPMMVGSDERRYAWMDEGFDTFINYYSGVAFSGGQPVLAGSMLPGQVAADERAVEVPIATPPDSLSEEALGFLAYNKPAAVLRMLRDQVLGAEVFDEAFREYIRRWAYKHPQPADFIRTMEDISGKELDWFFRAWIYEDATLDQAVAEVRRNGASTRVVIENRGAVVMPVEVRLVYQDGSDETRRLPVDVWRDGVRHSIVVEEKAVRHVQVDPSFTLPDVDRSNNTWGRGVIGRPPR